jgi:anaerobic selenocysteine-containing dehydrogenase
MGILRHGGTISVPYADHTAWQTPSGKMEILNHSLKTPVPHYLESYGGAWPLRLIAAPSSKTLNSTFLEREELVARRGPMTLAIHPDDAAPRGISDGDAVTSFNDLGEVAFTARVTPLVARGAVAAEGVFARAQSGNGNLVNTLHHERLSDIGEATTLNDNTVDVRKS